MAAEVMKIHRSPGKAFAAVTRAGHDEEMRLLLTAVVLLSVLAGCKAAPETPQAPATTTVPTTAAAQLSLPDVVGSNAEVAMDRLHRTGFKHVTFGSADPKAKVVVLPANWTVVGMEPAAGSNLEVKAAVVLKVVKSVQK
ncbi:PASTA domain-containing protein [Pseudonocardiaceae bacterium YIM PH 21723]|nr:PASTA domain-containing protein [Pseudonocardiaceae bacterium YIM PH 21723]